MQHDQPVLIVIHPSDLAADSRAAYVGIAKQTGPRYAHSSLRRRRW
ncbi:hypothetical protein ACFTWS_15805 [Streptomyces sp. NPDC057027]